MKNVRTGQAASSVKSLPTDGALIRVDELLFGSPRKLALHFLDHAQVVRVSLHASPQVEKQSLELHADDETGHAQVEVAKDEHVQIVKEVDGDHAHLEDKVNVVDDCAFVAPLRQAVDIAEVDGIAGEHVNCA